MFVEFKTTDGRQVLINSDQITFVSEGAVPEVATIIGLTHGMAEVRAPLSFVVERLTAAGGLISD